MNQTGPRAALGLGTAQFGFDYGITNPRGRIPEAEAAEILALASHRGVHMLDTAPVYGSSESVLGHLGATESFRIVTKIPAVPAGREGQFVSQVFAGSLERLKANCVYGLLFHRVEDLLGTAGHRLLADAYHLKATGRVEKVGVSVYTGWEIEQVMQMGPIDLIQLPLNVLDQRLIRSGHLAMLKTANVEIHARSVFLQGVLLEPTNVLERHLIGLSEHLQRYHRALKSANLTPLVAALSFVTSQAEVDTALIGVSSLAQWHQILEANQTAEGYGSFSFDTFALDDEALLNPAHWPAAATARPGYGDVFVQEDSLLAPPSGP